MPDIRSISIARSRNWSGALCAVPAVLILSIACAMPLVWMVGVLLLNPQVRAELHISSFRLYLLVRTVGYNGAAGLIATAMGLPAGLMLGRGRGLSARLLWVVLPAALLMPSLSYAYGWSQFVRLTRPAIWQPLHISFDPGGVADVARCIWSLAAWLWAIPAGLIGLQLRRLDPAVQQQALLDGGLLRVTLRQLLPAMIASIAIVTILATQEFAVYEPTGISVVATEVRMVFDTGATSSVTNSITGSIAQGSGFASPDQPARAAAAVATITPLLAVTAGLAALAARLAMRESAGDTLAVGAWPRILDAPRWAAVATALLLILNVATPVGALVRSLRIPLSVPHMWAEFGPQIGGSICLAAIAAGVTILCAFSAGSRWPRASLWLSGLAFLIGGQLLAIALIRIYNRPWLDWPYNHWPVPAIAYVGRFGWLAVASARSTWTRPWRELREMASVDGANAFLAAVGVVWPLAWPTLLAGGLLVGAMSLTEVPATVLLFPQNPQVLTPMLMTWLHMVRYDAMIEASLLMMLTVLVPAVAAVVLTGAGLRMVRRTRHAARGTRNEGGRGWRSLGLRSVLCALSSALLVTGCSRSPAPDAIWMQTGMGPGQVVYPRGIVYKPADDSFFVVDRMARIQHLDSGGNTLAEWRMPQWDHGKPVGISVGPDGNVYVPDTHYHRVIVYDPIGNELRRWGSDGTAPGQFIYPTDIAFDRAGRIYVGEYGDNDRIQVFDKLGNYERQFGAFGTGDGQFSRPQSIVIDDPPGLVYIADACNHRIDVLKLDGTWVRSMGTCGSAPGQFRFPYGLDEDLDGNLVVCEFGNNRVQKIDKQTGKCLGIWGNAGRDPGQLAYPWGVAVDRRGRVVAVDAGNNRLQVFQF